MIMLLWKYENNENNKDNNNDGVCYDKYEYRDRIIMNDGYLWRISCKWLNTNDLRWEKYMSWI